MNIYTKKTVLKCLYTAVKKGAMAQFRNDQKYYRGSDLKDIRELIYFLREHGFVVKNSFNGQERIRVYLGKSYLK